MPPTPPFGPEGRYRTVRQAPWPQYFVDHLNAQQSSPDLHPFTCGSGRRTDSEHLDGEGRLVATVDGWVCPYCDYTQDWA
jgi:hypothetical protein